MTHRFERASTLQEHITKVLEPATGSALHHWIPQFLLRQFTDEPQAGNPAIWCMSVDGGRPRLSCVHDEYAIKGHNLLVDPGDIPETAIEGLYGYMEGLVAPMVRTLIDGGSLDSEERSALSMFFAVQEQRTPRSRSDRHDVLEKLRTAVVTADAVSGGVQEIWCALSTRAIDETGVKPQLRDLLFAALERHLAPALFEPRSDWPSGPVSWAEVVVLGLR